MSRGLRAGLLLVLVVIGVAVAWALWGDDERKAQADEAGVSQPSIEGRVIDAAGQPIEGAMVDTDTGKTAQTDAQGRFFLDDLDAGVHRLDARADGFVTPGPKDMRRVAVMLSEEEGEGAVSDLELVLRRPASIRGRIVAAGEPVEGANIGVFYHAVEGLQGKLEPFSTDEDAVSDERGRFEIDDVAPGRLQLLVEADDYALKESRELLLEPGEALDELVVDLDPASTLFGEVVDTEGDPVAAEVVLSGRPLDRSRRIRANRDGRFSFRRVPEGRFRLEARAPGYRNELIDDIEVGSGERASYDVVMEAADGVFGRVVGPDDEPVEEAFVVLESSSLPRPKVVQTNDEGRFQWDEAAAKRYTATAVSPDFASSEKTRVYTGRDATLELGRGGTVIGRVIGPEGRPVQSFSVGVETAEVSGFMPYRPNRSDVEEVNDSAGRFQFDSLRPGTYWFRAQTERYANASSEAVEVRPGRTTSHVTIQVGEAGRVSGAVTDAESGEPVDGALVLLFEPNSPFPPNRTRTDSEGRFELDGVPPGRRSLRVMKKDYLPTVAGGLEVAPGGEVRRGVEIRRKKGGERMQFQGIGAVLQKDDDGIYIREALEGHPASEFGLASGDYIRAVDGESVEGMRLSEVIERIRGRQGAPVEIEAERDGEGRFSVEVERGQVVVK